MAPFQKQELDILYQEALPKVARLVKQYGGTLESARDIFHDALVIYWEKKQQPGFSLQSTSVAYVIGIARILCLKNNGQQWLPLEAAPAQQIPDDFYDPPVVNNTILSYIRTAGRKCLELLKAAYYEQLPMKEIAEKFGFRSPHSASVQKYKCLEKVREQLKVEDYAETFG